MLIDAAGRVGSVRTTLRWAALAMAALTGCVPHLTVIDAGIDAVDHVVSMDVQADSPVDAAPSCSFGQPQALTIGTPVTGMLSGMLSANATTTCNIFRSNTTAGAERVFTLDVPARTGLNIDLQRTDPLPDGGFGAIAVVAVRHVCEMQSTEFACSTASTVEYMGRPLRTVVEAGRYFLVVDSTPNPTTPEIINFRLTVTTFTPAPNSLCSTPSAFASSDPAATGDTSLGGPGLIACENPSSGPTNYYHATVPPQSHLTITGTPDSTAAATDVLNLTVVDGCTTAACFGNAHSVPAMPSNTPPTPAVPAVATAFNDSDTPQDIIVAVSGYPEMADGVPYSLSTTTGANSYTVSSITAACDDTSGGSFIAPSSGSAWTDDSASSVHLLPAPFILFGVNNTAYSVASNGFMQLYPSVGFPSAVYVNQPFPSPAGPFEMIAPFWDDLRPSTVPSGDIRLIRIVDANPRTTFSWNSWTIFAEANSLLTFQVHLLDTGVVEFHYCLLAITSGTTQPDRVYGSSATIGIQNDTGTDAVQHGYNRANTVTSGGGLRFTPR